jgi:hypothetical protein
MWHYSPFLLSPFLPFLCFRGRFSSNLYLRRTQERLSLSSEHRVAAASPPVYLELIASDAATAHLEVVGEAADGKRRGLEERVLELLASGVVLTRANLRAGLAVQNERLGAALESLERAGQVCRTPEGWRRGDRSPAGGVPVPQ